MAFTVQFRLINHNDRGLRNAPIILGRELRGAMSAVGSRLQRSAEIRMRNDTGRERKSLQTKVEGRNLDYSVRVYSTLLQAFTDAYGLKRGVRVPWGFNSKIFAWSERRVRGLQSEGPRQLFEPHEGYRPKRRKARDVTPVRQLKGATKTTGLTQVRTNRAGQRRLTLAKRMSFLVARSVFKKGLRATHWNREALNANRGRITRELQNAISRAVNKINRG